LAPQPEQQARGNIDVLLAAAGWRIRDAATANVHVAHLVANREFPNRDCGLSGFAECS